MRKVFRLFTASLGAVLFLAVSQFNHVSAMQMPHDMTGMSHGSSTGSSQTCATLCSTMTVGKEDILSTDNLKDEDEPEPPYYTLFQTSYEHLDSLHAQKPYTPDLPLKVPIHIRHCVFRS
jgi:hypothetical protein